MDDHTIAAAGIWTDNNHLINTKSLKLEDPVFRLVLTEQTFKKLLQHRQHVFSAIIITPTDVLKYKHTHSHSKHSKHQLLVSKKSNNTLIISL